MLVLPLTVLAVDCSGRLVKGVHAKLKRPTSELCICQTQKQPFSDSAQLNKQQSTCNHSLIYNAIWKITLSQLSQCPKQAHLAHQKQFKKWKTVYLNGSKCPSSAHKCKLHTQATYGELCKLPCKSKYMKANKKKNCRNFNTLQHQSWRNTIP